MSKTRCQKEKKQVYMAFAYKNCHNFFLQNIINFKTHIYREKTVGIGNSKKAILFVSRMFRLFLAKAIPPSIPLV